MGRLTVHFEIEGIDVTGAAEIRTDLQNLWGTIHQAHPDYTVARNSLDYYESTP